MYGSDTVCGSFVMSGLFSEVGLIQLFDVRASFRYIKLHIVSDCECSFRCYPKLVCCSPCEEVEVNQSRYRPRVAQRVPGS